MAKKQTDAESAKPKMAVITASDVGLQDAEMVAINELALSTAVRAFFQNTRQGTVGVKERSDVAFSTRKPWKQKGTGRARAGSRRSPLWRKGGVTFGPQPRVRKLSMPRKVRKQVMTAIFHQYLEGKKIASLEWQSGETPKTRLAAQMLFEAGILNKGNVRPIVLFVDRNDINTIHSFRNLPMVNLLPFDTPNVYEMTRGETWAFLAKDVEQFKMMVAQWI